MRLGLAQGSNNPAIQSVQSMPKDSFSGTTKISCARPSGTVWNSTEGQSAEAMRKLVKFSGVSDLNQQVRWISFSPALL